MHHFKPSTARALTDRELDAIAGGSSGATADIEQVLNIGSQSSGAGAGKIKFNEFSVTR